MYRSIKVIGSLIAYLLISTCHAQPTVDGYKVYYGDLHNHCTVSDGQGTIDDAYNYAKNTSHLDFFGLSDHANLISATEWTQTKNTANAYNQDSVFTAFYGFEWTTYLSYGHVTIVNTDDYCSNSGSTSNFSGLLSWLNSRNGIAFFNHPGWEFYTYNEFNHFTDTPSSKFVGMELWNTQDGFSKYYYNDGYYSGDGGKGYYDEALVRHWKIGAAGGDDNHTANWGNVKPWRTGVLATAKTRADILGAYQARRTFSTLDKTLALSLKVNGFMMGSTILGGNWNAELNAFDQENEVFTQVDLIKNGAVIYSTNPNSTHPVIVRPVACADGDYFYFRVKQADGDEAISSPVFISGVAQPPVVAITSPVSGAIFTAGSDVTISANASDVDGTIATVEFFKNGALIGQDNTAPYNLTVNGIEEGNHLLTAKAYDNLGLSSTSGVISIVVNPVPVLSVLPGNMDVSPAAGSATFDVNSNVAWIATSDQPWCTVTSAGSGTGTITAEYLENTSATARVAVVTVTGSGLSPVSVTLTQQGIQPRVLNLEMLLQGLYDGNGTMRAAQDESGDEWGSGIADKISVELHDGSDYQVIHYQFDNVDLMVDGSAVIQLPTGLTGSYYLTIKHRNSITIVSAFPVSFAGPTVDFSFNTVGNVFWNNLFLLPDGHRVIFGGDVNQDGIVDAGDMLPVDNGSRTFLAGYYAQDANGDGLVDATDMMIVDNNGANFVTTVHP